MNFFYEKFQVIAGFTDTELAEKILSTYSVFPCDGFDVLSDMQPTEMEDIGCIKGEFSLEGLDNDTFDKLFAVVIRNMENALNVYAQATDMGWAIITKISPGNDRYMGWTYCKGDEHNNSGDVLKKLITNFVTNNPDYSLMEKQNVSP